MDHCWPAGLEARPIALGDAAAWAVLRAAMEEVDHEGENYDVDDLIEELNDPKLDVEEDTIGLWAGGAMVGYAVVRWRVHVVDVHQLRTEATVHPDWRDRGVGSALLAWQIRRASELHEAKHPEADGEVGAFVISTNTGAGDLLVSHGFLESRYFFTMHRPFDVPLPDVAPPDGLRVVAFDASYNHALRLAHNEAFLDHWGSSPQDEETWNVGVVGSRGFRGGVSRMVLAGDKIVSYALGYEHLADTEATGVREIYIGQVGTFRSHRGRGLARVALAALMTEARQTGFQRAALTVDSANETGALGLYERLGFTQVAKSIAFRRPLT